MKHEYDAICAAGLLQAGRPDLARGRHQAFARLSDQEWRHQVGLHQSRAAQLSHCTETRQAILIIRRS
jgi:hypothetical protein